MICPFGSRFESVTLENGNNIGEIEETEVITLVCSFLNGAFETRTTEQSEFICQLITSIGCPVDVLHVLFEIRKHIIANGSAGELRFANDQC